MIRFETDRLIICDAELIDFNPLLKIYRQEVNMKFISNGKADWTMNELTAKYERFNSVGSGFGLYVIKAKEGGSVIGEVGLFNSFNNIGIAELGYIIDHPYQNKGIGTELCEELIKYTFDMLGKEKVVARMYADNINSVKLSEKLGMKRLESGQSTDGRAFYRYELSRSDL